MSIISDFLSIQVKLSGVASVQRELKQFLKLLKNKRINIIRTKRKAVPRAWTYAALSAQGNECGRCHQPLEKSLAQGDHFIALVQGGEHKRTNIVALHKSCNSQKGGRDINQDIKYTNQTILERLPKIEVSNERA